MVTAKNKSSPAATGGTRRLGRGWFLAGLLLVLGFNFFIRVRLAATPLERDEGEYAYTGQLLLQGIPPYQLAYNMKFPGTYLAYALIMAVGGETTQGIHVGLAFVTSLTAVLVAIISGKLSGRAAGLLAAASYVLLAATPAAFGLAGHATHFVALFTTAGTLALLAGAERPTLWRWGLAGLLFGSAILMKQHAVLLAGAGLAWLGWRMRRAECGVRNAEKAQTSAPHPTLPLNRPTPGRSEEGSKAGGARRNSWSPLMKSGVAYCLGCALPLLVTTIYLAAAGVWRPFIFWTIQYASQYASAVSIQTAGISFQNGFSPVFNATWPLWLLGLIGGGAVLFSRDRLRLSLGVLLLLGGMLAAVPGYHFRGHYFLAAMPGLALLIGAALAAAWQRISDIQGRVILSGVVSSALAVTVWSNWQIWFQLTPDQVARQMYSLNPFLESPKVADYLRANTAPGERIAVVGSEPQIYFHAGRPSATGYIYMYALTEPQPYAQKMRAEFAREIETAQPRYIVFVDIITSWVSLSAADTTVLTWWNQFAQNYEPVGAVALAADQPTHYVWDEATVRTLDLTQYHLIVYRKKP